MIQGYETESVRGEWLSEIRERPWRIPLGGLPAAGGKGVLASLDRVCRRAWFFKHMFDRLSTVVGHRC